MFWRICNLLTLNIELVFVFDGPDKPPKPGRRNNGRRINPRERELLKELLNHWGMPYIDAPGEAEAECCHLQKLGRVDAVWSQDSDCLMFGCELWLRDHRIPSEHGFDNRNKGHTKKDAKTVRVVRAGKLRTEHRLRREGCVLFAMLKGGDYDTVGLRGCGTDNALKAAKSGIGISLCNAKGQEDCDQWRVRVLLPFFKRENITVAVPDNFPSFKMLQNYNRPKISSDLQILNNPELMPDFRRTISEIPLLRVTSHRFNTWGEGYMDWVSPTMLVRFLADRDPSLPKEVVHGIVVVRTPKAKAQTDVIKLERKITFSPFGLTQLVRPVFEGVMHGYWRRTGEKLFDPNYRVECEIPEYLLRKVLPLEVLDPPVATKGRPSKRKRVEDVTEQDDQPVSTKRGTLPTRTATLNKSSRISNGKPPPHIDRDLDDDLRVPQSRTRVPLSIQPARAGLQSAIGSYRSSESVQGNQPHPFPDSNDEPCFGPRRERFSKDHTDESRIGAFD
jgi:Holliday junction resolvase YEN1